MSGGIQLSSELVEDIIAILVKHDESAKDDLILMQYMSAITAYVLAHQTDPAMDKRSLLKDLNAFMGQVFDQVEGDLMPKPAQEEAFGIWKPDQT